MNVLVPSAPDGKQTMLARIWIMIAPVFLAVAMACGGGGGGSAAKPKSIPSFSLQPSAQVALDGDAATFTVTASGNPTPTYQWQFAPSGTSTWANVTTGTGGTTASYTTAALAVSDSGTQYRVTATNSEGSATSDAVAVTVHPKPVISAFTATPAIITAGDSSTLAFAFTGGSGTINQSVGSVTSGSDKVVTPASDTTYTLTVDNGFGTTVTRTATVSVAPVPVAPSILAPINVTTGRTGLVASVTAQTGMVYAWSISGGTITSATTGTAITFNAGPVGTLSLTCTATNAASASASSMASVNVVAAPVATSLVASSVTPLHGATVDLTPTFSGGTGSIDQGIGTVNSGTKYPTAAMTAAKTFTLTVTNVANDTAIATVTVTPQTVSVGAISPANPYVTVNDTVTFSSTVSGALDPGLTWSATGGTINPSTGVWTAPATPGGPYTITATSVADATKTATTTVTAVPLPAPPVIVVAPNVTTGKPGLTASVDEQAGMTYSWTISGGTITAGANTRQITFTAGAVGTLTLNCGATNAANTTSFSGNYPVSVVAAPSITTLGVETNTPLYGGTVWLWPVFKDGTGSIDQGIGTVNSDTKYTSSALTTATTFTLTVTNAANDTAIATVTVTPQTVSVGAISPANSSVTVNGSTIFSSTVSGALNTGITWSATGGTIVPGTGAWTAAATPGGPFTITATSAADPSKSATTTVTTVAAPVATITAPSVAASGATGLTASVASQSGCTYAWTISGGTITSADNINSITFTAGAVGTLTLNCTVTNAASTSASGSANVDVQALPVINVFTATPSTVASGEAVTLHFEFTGGAGSINQGVDAVTSNVDKIVNPTATTTYTLTVTPAVGSPVTRNVTVTVSASGAPKITQQPESKRVTPPDGATFTVTATGSDLHYAWYQGSTQVGSDSPSYAVSATDLYTFPYQTTYTVVVSNTISSETSTDAILTVVAPSPTYAGDPVATAGQTLTTLPSKDADSQRFPNGAFRFGYSEALKNPVWTAYANFPFITAYSLSGNDPWTPDVRLATPRVDGDDYNFASTGFTRGHQVPQSNIGKRYGQTTADNTCVMSNLAPQYAAHNNNIWNSLEQAVDGPTGSFTTTFGRLWIYTGPTFDAVPARHTGTVSGASIAVPSGFYKVIVREEGGTPKVLAVLTPHKPEPLYSDIWKYATSVARIEEVTGLNLFPSATVTLPAEFKSKVDVRGWGTSFERDATLPNVHMVKPSWDTTATSGTELTFVGDATSSGSTIASTAWTFGDGGTATGYTAPHTYAAGGTFIVTFTATEADGSTASISRTLTVSGPVNNAPTITAIADQTTGVNGVKSLAFTVADTETAAAALVVSYNSSNTTLIPNGNLELVGPTATGACTLIVTPAANLQGTASITVRVTDGGGLYAERTFTVSVGLPTITSIADQTTAVDTPVTVGFTVNDTETAAAGLVVTASSSNTTLVPNANLVLTGPDAVGACSYLITPATGQSGSATITITVSDGTSTAQRSFNLTVGAAATPNLIISQYYEGTGTGTNRWIEITNIGSQAVNLTGYYLAGYNNKTDLNLDGVAPSNKYSLTGTLAAGASVLFKQTGAVLPAYASGTAADPCGFNGNDIVILSTSNGTSCWTDRIDVVGTTGNWGVDTSFYRAGSVHLPNKTFTLAEWVQVATTAVDGAASSESQYLGYHVVTP